MGRNSLGTELFLQNKLSVGLNVDYISRGVYIESVYATNRPGDPMFFEGGDTHKRGVILEPQIRWYTSKTDGQGTYVAISGFFGYARYSPIEWEGLGGLEPMEWKELENEPLKNPETHKNIYIKSIEHICS